jgi:hypothetical protein
MRTLKTIYDTIWFKIRPVWYSTDSDETLYPTWRACWETARILNS